MAISHIQRGQHAGDAAATSRQQEHIASILAALSCETDGVVEAMVSKRRPTGCIQINALLERTSNSVAVLLRLLVLWRVALKHLKCPRNWLKTLSVHVQLLAGRRGVD